MRTRNRNKQRKVRVWHETNEPKIGKNINWKGWGANEIVKILNELSEVGEVPTIRGVWYILVSKFPKIIPNTSTIYSSFDHITVLCRSREMGYPPIATDAFADDTRVILNIDSDIFIHGEKVADSVLQTVKDSRNKYYIPRWYKQKNYCESWVEKRAITRMFVTILRNGDIDRQIRIVPNNGWPSVTYVAENIERLYTYWNAKFIEIGSVLEDKKTYPHIWVFYSGDCDPSGRRMDLNIARDLMNSFRKRFYKVVMTDERIPIHRRRAELSRRMTTIHFKRIAVTIKQISEFDLEHLTDPDQKAQLKMEGGWDENKGRNKKGDPNTPWFKKMFKWYKEGQVFQIEIDAMFARREQFKQLLLQTFDEKFDNDIYNEHVAEKMKSERDLLTLRLKDKLINEDIQLSGWDIVEARITKYKSMVIEFAAQAFKVDWVFLALLSSLNYPRIPDFEDENGRDQGP